MAYEKQSWSTGDVITADKLNHMEDGIYIAKDDNDFIIEVEFDSVNEFKYVANKTIEEINEAFTEGKKLKVKYTNLYYTFKEHNTSMAGDTYTFVVIEGVEPFFESSTQVNLTFGTIYISDGQIKVIQKTASLNVQ